MLILISPAKTLDFASPQPTRKFTGPQLLDLAEPLVTKARKLSAPKLKALMGISDKLAAENVQRFKSWSRPFTLDNARQAIYAFRGDVYQGLDVDSLSTADMTWAQKHLRLLSGLYGVLRPLDLIQPYRLEMGLPFAVGRSRNLYAYWGRTITDVVNETMKATRSKVLVNLASQEYFNVIDRKAINGTIITPSFKEHRDGKLRLISFSAKRARGMMARYIIRKRITKVEDLQGFDDDRYKYDAKASTDDAPLFTRSHSP